MPRTRPTGPAFGMAPLLTSLLAFAMAMSSPTKTTFADPDTPADPPADILADWHGKWAGEMRIERPGQSAAQRVPMTLEIAPTADAPGAEWHWRLTFGNGEQAQLRDYRLCAIDAANGHFVIDEGNSIRIDATKIGDTFFCDFTVQSARISCRYALDRSRADGPRLEVEIVAWHPDASTSGGDGRIPAVESRRVQVTQRAHLTRAANAPEDGGAEDGNDGSGGEFEDF